MGNIQIRPAQISALIDGATLRPNLEPIALAADSEADEDDCAGDGPEDAARIARVSQALFSLSLDLAG